MPIQLDQKNRVNIDNQLHSIVKSTMDEISAYADEAQQTIVESTHIIRKRLKFLRAVVKLTMHCSEDDTYKKLNILFRDCGREISDCRDLHVRGLLLQEFKQNTSYQSILPLLDELEQLNQRKTEREEQRLLSSKNVFIKIYQRISGNQDFKEYFSNLEAKPEAIISGFTRGYSKSYMAFHSSLESEEPDSLHEWRKRTKDLQYQYEVLAQTIPDTLPPDYEEVVELCESLGRINDLFMISEWITANSKTAEYSGQVPELLDDIHQDIDELCANAEQKGVVLYRFDPDEYEDKLSGHILE